MNFQERKLYRKTSIEMKMLSHVPGLFNVGGIGGRALEEGGCTGGSSCGGFGRGGRF